MADKSEFGKTRIVSWRKEYATGIELIDQQHQELVNLTNRLYQACLGGDATVGAAFEEAMHNLVKYVRFHFTAELVLLKRVKFPGYEDHAKQHDTLVRNILKAVKDFNAGKRLIPNKFVRTLEDWVFGHIAVSDVTYATYVAEQKALGRLTDKQINGVGL